jgi:hypothetical protein
MNSKKATEEAKLNQARVSLKPEERLWFYNQSRESSDEQ